MKKHTVNNVKLGAFVLAGLLFLMVLLYFIGRDQSLFGSTFVVKARFENVQGLVAGNNVRYAGIEVGTVKRINILNDTLIEVAMIVDNKMKEFIRKNAIAAIGTDGLMGNKVINISPAREPAPLISEDDILASKGAIDTDKLFRTLNQTNEDVAVIAENLKSAVIRINASTALWRLLNDHTLPQNIRTSAANVELATARASELISGLQDIVNGIKNGEGSLGAIIKDTSFAKSLNETLLKIRAAGNRADELAVTMNAIAGEVRQEMLNGKGPVNALLKDSAMVTKLNSSLSNIQMGTDAFNQNMEALKHSLLFRGYFRKLERQKQKDNRHQVVSK